MHTIKNFIKNLLPDIIYLKLLFRRRMGKKLNLKNPITFNEKLQWLKLYDRNPEYTKMVDKYKVREYIANTIGEQYLVPLLGVYNNFDEIDFSKLPNQFVLKCTHDSGGLVICKDKDNFDIKQAKKKINNSLEQNYYYRAREWPYKNVAPKVICEKYMEEKSGIDLKDFKFMCFNGVVKCIFVCSNRNSENGLNIDIYDENWDLMPFGRPQYPNSGIKIEKPMNFEKMIKISEKLSENIPFLRVDFYEINGNLFFGELTLYPGAGFEKFQPEEYDEILGSWIELPPIKS